MAQDEWVDDPSPDGDWVDDDKVEKPSMLESGIRGLGQGAALGFWDELAGAGEALGQSVGIKGLGDSDWSNIGLTKPLALDDERDFGQAYTEGRDKWRGEDALAKEANPKTFGAGEVGGSIASSMIPGLNIGKGASLANIAGKSALAGGLSGIGYSDSEDPDQILKEAAKSAAIGGGLGGTLGAVAPKVGQGLDYLMGKTASGAREAAEGFGARALGAERGTIKKLGRDKVMSAAGQALDEGVFSPLASTDDLIARNNALKKRGGEMMGSAYNAIDEAGASTFNPLEVASKVDEEIGGFYRSPINRGETNQLENTLESIMMRGDGPIPINEAQALKEELGKVANWKNNVAPSEKERMARQAYGIVNNAIDEAMEKGAGAVEQAGLGNVLKQGKKLYGNASTAETLLENKQAREQGNKILGITDWGVLGAGGAGAAVTGGASLPATAALLAGKKGLERYGSQNAALGLNKVSQILKKSPKMGELYGSNPQAFNMMSQRIADKAIPKEQENPYDQSYLLEKTKGTKYSSVMEGAAKRGEKAVGATNFILQQVDPDYRKQILGAQGSEDEDNE